MLKGDKQSVKEKMQSLENVYEKFNLLNSESEVVKDDYLIHDLYYQIFQDVDCFLNDKVKDLDDKHKTLFVTPPSLSRPDPFSGDPREFLPWLNAVEVFLRQIPSIEERILALVELTSGAARASIEAFLFEPKTQATLQAALKELKEQFGSEEVVSQLYLQSLEEFPNIPDHNVEELRKYICLLKKGRSMSKAYPTLEILENRAFVRTLVAKLPDELRESWVKMLLKEEKEKPLGLSTFLVFLEDHLKVWRHPLCLGRAPSSPN